MKGWYRDSLRHSLAARHITTSRYKKRTKVVTRRGRLPEVVDDEAIVRKRGKTYRVQLKSEGKSDAELKRLATMPLSDIKKRYKNSFEEEYYALKGIDSLMTPQEKAEAAAFEAKLERKQILEEDKFQTKLGAAKEGVPVARYDRDLHRAMLFPEEHKLHYPLEETKPRSYPHLYVSDEIQEIPAQGQTMDEYENKLKANLAKSSSEKAELQKQLTTLRVHHPVLAVKAASQARDQAELARLESQYAELKQAHMEAK